jgi:hypothetical protein
MEENLIHTGKYVIQEHHLKSNSYMFVVIYLWGIIQPLKCKVQVVVVIMF